MEKNLKQKIKNVASELVRIVDIDKFHLMLNSAKKSTDNKEVYLLFAAEICNRNNASNKLINDVEYITDYIIDSNDYKLITNLLYFEISAECRRIINYINIKFK